MSSFLIVFALLCYLIINCAMMYYATLRYTILTALLTFLFYTVLHSIVLIALAEKGMTAEQYDKLTEMQRIKPKDDEEAKVTVVPILPTLPLK